MFCSIDIYFMYEVSKGKFVSQTRCARTVNTHIHLQKHLTETLTAAGGERVCSYIHTGDCVNVG